MTKPCQIKREQETSSQTKIERLSGPWRPHTFWLLVLVWTVLGLQACGSPVPPRHDAEPPRITVAPAGGLYREWPKQITLTAEPGVTLHYRWTDGKDQDYREPISVPAEGPSHQILQFWTEDASGYRTPMQREHYVRVRKAPGLALLDIDSTVLGGNEQATLRWRSSAADATYEIAVTNGGWGPGKRLAQGRVTPDSEHQTTISGSDLYAGRNRLWVRVRNADGRVAAASRWLTAHTTPVFTQAWPPGGVFGSAQTVSLLTSRTATVYYTTDGTAPTRESTVYTEPFTIDQTTTVRFFSVDAYGNQEAPQQASFTLHPQAATITLQPPVQPDIGTAAPTSFTWQCNQEGRYEVVLQNRANTWKRTVQQGMVKKNEKVNSTIARNFLSPGDWFIHIRVQPNTGVEGEVVLPVRVDYRETFADMRYLNPETSTAAWDINQQQVSLARGPRLVSTYRTRGRSRRVTMRGPHAYLADSKGGLHIVDVSTPEAPRRIGGFYPHGQATALAVHQSYVYMAASGTGLAIFDVTQPSWPRLMTTVPIRGAASDITIVAPYAYVGTQAGSLIIFDLSTPLQPRQVGQVDVGGRVVDSAVQTGTAYVACLDKGLVIVDVRTPEQPRVVHRQATKSAATGVAVHDHYVLVAAGGVEVFDVTQPEAPISTITHYTQSAYGVSVHPPYAVIASGTDGIQIVKITERSPVVSSPSAHYAARLSVNGDRTLLADTRGGLRVFDLSQPTQPQVRLMLDHIGTIVDVAVDGNVAYLANDQQKSGLVVVDLSQPDSLRVIGWYHSDMTTDVAVWDHWALLSDLAGLVQLVDVQQVNRPRLRHTLTLTGKPQRVDVIPPYAYVASDDGGVHVVEITPEARLVLRTTVPIPGRALDLARLEDTFYVAAVEGGIQMLDVRHPAQPVIAASYAHPDGAENHIIRVVAGPERLYAIDNRRGIQVLGRSGNQALQLQQSLQVPEGAPWGLATDGPYLFVTTLLSSLYTFELTSSSQAKLLSTAPYGGSSVTAIDRLLYIAVRGRRGVPGGLQLVEAFASVSDEAFGPLRARGVTSLPDASSGMHRVHRAYTFSSPSVVESIAISIPEAPVQNARLQVQDFWGSAGRIDYALSNDGGAHWHPAQPGVWLRFPTPGTDLRWRATLETADVVQTPLIESIRIEVSSGVE